MASIISPELFRKVVEVTPMGVPLFGLYEILAKTGVVRPRVDIDGEQVAFSLVDNLGAFNRGNQNRAVAFYTNTYFSRLAVYNNDVLGREGLGDITDSTHPGVITTIETGSFNLSGQRIEADFEEAPVNGRIVRINMKEYPVQSEETGLYGFFSRTVEEAFRNQFGNLDRLIYINH